MSSRHTTERGSLPRLWCAARHEPGAWFEYCSNFQLSRSSTLKENDMSTLANAEVSVPTASPDVIESLARTVYSSIALDNDFYDLWTSRKLSPAQIAIFARNYGEFNRA